MEIIKRANGDSFREKIYLTGGKAVTKTFARKTDARLWKQQMLTDRSRGLAHAMLSARSSSRYRDHFEEWLRVSIEPRRSEKTVADYRSVGRRHLVPLVGQKRLTEITSDDGDQLVMQLKAKGLKNKTANKIITIFKQTILFAIRNERLTRNPLAGLSTLTVEQSKIRFLTDLQTVQLLSVNARQPFYPLLLIAVNTGMRIGEISGLCWDRVDFGTNQIQVTRTLARGKLKDATKTHLIRYIPMNPEVKDVLKALHRKQQDTRFVFVTECGKPYNADHFSQRVFRNALVESGLPPMRFHDLRHTFASQFVMKGGSVFDLQKLLGHTKIEMTSKYAHLNQDYLTKAVQTVRFSADGDKSVSPYLAHASQIRDNVVAIKKTEATAGS